MTRSSRSKSHKQSKHSSKEVAAREYSGSDEDVKMKDRSSNGGKEDGVSFRLSKDSSVAGERRKHGKELSGNHGNGDVSEEHTTSSRRREEKSQGGSDRWNAGISEEKGIAVNIENKELLKSRDSAKVAGESKSKSNRRHDAESASAVVLEKDISKSGSGNRSEKRNSEKESTKKENSHYKENKESKDKDLGSDRGRKAHPDKLNVETSSKQVETQSIKRGKETFEWPIEEGLRNPELEKELEKRMRRREGLSDKDKYHENTKEGDDRRLSTRSERLKEERHKDGGYGDVYKEDSERDRKNRDVKHRGENERFNKHRDDKHREDGERDKHRDDKYSEDGNRGKKYKDDKYREEGVKDSKRRGEKNSEIGDRDERRRQDDDRDYRHKEEKHREDRGKRSRDSKYRDVRDNPIEPEAKRLRDDSGDTDLYPKKTINRDASPVYDDHVSRYKVDKDRRRGNDKDESSEYRSFSMKEQHSESEKRSSAKVDSVSDRGRIGSRYADVDISGSHSRRRSSPGRNSYTARDPHRVSKQEEAKHRDYVYEERARQNTHSSKDFPSAPGQSDKFSSRSAEKLASKDDNNIGDLSGEKRLRPDTRSSPQVDKSPSSTSNERRNLSKSDVRKSLEREEPWQKSSASKDAKEHMGKDGKGSRELVMEAYPDNDFSQVDGDNLSVSSPYTRSTHFSEDDRNKSNNRHRRMPDPNIARAQGNWKNVPNWSTPLATGGYIPFSHVPPPMFHPLMQQFPPPIFGRPSLKLNPGLPYHVPDHARPWRNQMDESIPPTLHQWDANNAVFDDESHLYGRVDWDRRTQLTNRGWDPMHSASQNSVQRPAAEIWSGQPEKTVENEQNQVEVPALGSQNIDVLERNDKIAESSRIFEVEEEDNTIISQVYLSRVDVSEDLAQPEVYEQCVSLMHLDQEISSDEIDCKILFLEEDVEGDVTDSASLFPAANAYVFQKAMFLYKKQKEEFNPMKRDTISSPTNNPEFLPPSDQEKGASDDGGKRAEEEEGTVMEVSKESDELLIQNHDTNPVFEANFINKPMDVEVDHALIVKQEEEEPVSAVNVSIDPCGGAGGGYGGSAAEVVAAEVAVMPRESIEFGSVNLSRIHTESTH